MKLKDMTIDQLIEEFLPRKIWCEDFTGKDAIAELRRRLTLHDNLVAALTLVTSRYHNAMQNERTTEDIDAFSAAMTEACATLAKARGEK